MKNLLNKELKLAASPLSYLFILFALLTFAPGYPILVGAFFITFGIYNSFQSARENNDILYTVLLPLRKADAVNAKFIFSVFIEMSGFVLTFIFTIIRMTVFKNSPVFTKNALMNANQAYLGYMLIIFALFNLIFISGFYKTAYKYGKPFIVFIIATFVIVAITETLHHIPGLTFLNDTNSMASPRMWIIFVICTVFYVIITLAAKNLAIKRFEQVDM